MGDHKNNPRSSQFIDPHAPEYRIGAMLDAIAVPTKAWEAAHPKVEGEPEQALCGPEDLEVVIVMRGLYEEPSPLISIDKYPRGQAIVGELIRFPFVWWRDQIKGQNPQVKWRETEHPPEVLDS